jgi:hypothetical protein
MTLEKIGIALSLFDISTKIAGEMKKRRDEPVLRIETILVQDFKFPDETGSMGQQKSAVRRFIIAKIINVGRKPADGCVGYLESDQTIIDQYKLHWADIEYLALRNSTTPITIQPGESRDLDIAFTIGEPSSDSTALTSGQPISVTTGQPISLRSISFGSSSAVPIEQPQGPGAWVANPIGLCYPTNSSQAYLKPGKYKMDLRVVPNVGKSDQLELLVTAPEDWKKLTASV